MIFLFIISPPTDCLTSVNDTGIYPETSNPNTWEPHLASLLHHTPQPVFHQALVIQTLQFISDLLIAYHIYCQHSTPSHCHFLPTLPSYTIIDSLIHSLNFGLKSNHSDLCRTYIGLHYYCVQNISIGWEIIFFKDGHNNPHHISSYDHM